jgi:hypothetical protein
MSEYLAMCLTRYMIALSIGILFEEDPMTSAILFMTWMED